MKPVYPRWQLQEAKNKLSRVVRDADEGGPQYITVRGEDHAVVLSASDFENLSRRNDSLSSALLCPQFEEEEAAELFERSKDIGRKVDL